MLALSIEIPFSTFWNNGCSKFKVHFTPGKGYDAVTISERQTKYCRCSPLETCCSGDTCRLSHSRFPLPSISGVAIILKRMLVFFLIVIAMHR